MRSLGFNFGVVLCGTFLLTSCSVLFPTKLAKRYKTNALHNYASNDSIKYIVGVNGYAFELEKKKVKPESVKNIFSLSPEGQRQLIEAIGDNEKTSDEVFNKLALNIGDELTPPKTKDNTRFTKRLIFSVANLSTGQADRILKLSIALALKGDDNLKIISCDKVVTNYQTVDLAKANYSNASTNAKIAVNKINNTNAVTDKSVGVSKTMGTEVSSKRYVSLSSYVTAKSINFYEESVSGVDLTGNIIADVAFEYPNSSGKIVYSFSGLQNRDKTYAKPNDIVTTQQRIFYPNIANDITLSYTYEATVRKVVKGEQTISESDDDIQIVKGGAAGPEILVATKEQLIPKIWKISDGINSVEITGPLAQSPLLFDNYETALDFILWLKRASSDILANNRISGGDYQIMVSGGSILTDSFIKNCTVKSF